MPQLNPITLLIVIFVGLGVLAVVATVFKRMLGPQADRDGVDEYELKTSLFSAAERSFLGVLESIDFDDLSLCYKVRLADVFDVKKGYNRGRWQRVFNRISAKHIDFLLIRKSDGKPVLGIELDDKSHQKTKGIERDRFVDGVFKSGGLPLLRVKAQATYNPKDIMRRIEQTINRSSESELR
mgnify:CR=1 FL=1